ncbi:hypothetical protein ACLOJK_006189 [Asimina triloba]
MRLRERLLRDANKEPEDPLDLMAIGQHAHLDAQDERENPLYEWLKSADLDERDGVTARAIAKEARDLGVDVEAVMSSQHQPNDEHIYDPLTRHSIPTTNKGASTSQASVTRVSSRSIEDDVDGGDGGGEDGGGGANYEIAKDDIDNANDSDMHRTHVGGRSQSQSQRLLNPFTGEKGYTHATQDEDHGAHPRQPKYCRRTRGWRVDIGRDHLKMMYS